MHSKNCFDFQNERVSRSKSHCVAVENKIKITDLQSLKKNIFAIVCSLGRTRYRSSRNLRKRIRSREVVCEDKVMLVPTKSRTYLFVITVYFATLKFREIDGATESWTEQQYENFEQSLVALADDYFPINEDLVESTV